MFPQPRHTLLLKRLSGCSPGRRHLSIVRDGTALEHVHVHGGHVARVLVGGDVVLWVEHQLHPVIQLQCDVCGSSHILTGQ